jgi:hypothetical protein
MPSGRHSGIEQARKRLNLFIYGVLTASVFSTSLTSAGDAE